MKKIPEKILLKYMIELLISYLTELADISDCPEEQFSYGEKTAYTECLEILSYWEDAETCGLNFNIEERFPLM